MANSAQKNHKDSPDFAPDPKELFQLIDTSMYKQILIFLAVSLVIAAGIYFYLRFGQEQIVNQQVTPPGQDEQTQQQIEEEKQIQEQFSTDQQRKNDVVQINSALKSYFLEKKKAPDSLEALAPDILSTIPKDPKTGSEYSYQVAEDKQSWTVSTILSDGIVFEQSGPN